MAIHFPPIETSDAIPSSNRLHMPRYELLVHTRRVYDDFREICEIAMWPQLRLPVGKTYLVQLPRFTACIIIGTFQINIRYWALP